MPGAALRQIRQLQRIGQRVVTIKAQQRVGVDQQRRNGAGEKHHPTHIAKQARLHGECHKQGQRGHKTFHHHARSAHGKALPWHCKSVGGAGVYKRRWGQRHQGDAPLRHAPAVAFDGQAVGQLVKGFEPREDQPSQPHHMRRGHPAGTEINNGGGVERRCKNTAGHHQKPHRQARRAEDGAAQRRQCLQQRIGVAQGNSNGQPIAFPA